MTMNIVVIHYFVYFLCLSKNAIQQHVYTVVHEKLFENCSRRNARTKKKKRNVIVVTSKNNKHEPRD